MRGFEGPFEFDIDEEGTAVPWDGADAALLEALEKEGRYTRENSTLFEVRVAVLPRPDRVEKKHDWSRIRRIFVEAKTGSHSMSIRGISPVSKQIAEIPTAEMPFLKAMAGAKLFESLQFKLKVSGPVKQFARSNRYAVISFYSKRSAQWVFSEGWEDLGFRLCLVVVVPNDLPQDKRSLLVSVKPTWRQNLFLTQVAVWGRQVRLSGSTSPATG